MPGSTASPSDPSKAKVTSATTNGTFVRPVAVAGIFRPSNESSNAPPALPEKKRFSALAGDIKSCSSNEKPESDDLARRRQSWATDAPQNQILFGQALLRRTPRSNNAPTPRTVKSNSICVGNGAVPEINSEPSDDKKLLETPPNKNSDAVKAPQSSNSESREFVAGNGFIKSQDDKVERKQSSVSSTSRIHKELVSNKTDVKVEKSLPPTCLTELNSNKIAESDQAKRYLSDRVSENQSATSTDTVKQTKKVFGLIKREHKSEVSTVTNDSSANVTNASVDVKNVIAKPKVYGLNKQTIKKDVEVVKLEKESTEEKKPVKIQNTWSRSPLPGKDSEKTFESKASSEIKTSEAKVSSDTQVSSAAKVSTDAKVSSGAKVSTDAKVSSGAKVSADAKVSSGAKVSTDAKVSSESKVSTDAKVSSESKVFSDAKVSSEAKPDAKLSSESDKLNNESRVSKSPPKDFRTVRRTSDVIAARIQSMFSNFQSEKSAPVLPKKSKIPDKGSSPIGKISSDNETKSAVAVKDEKTDSQIIPEVKNKLEKSAPVVKDQKSVSSSVKIESSSSTKESKSTVIIPKEKSNLDNEVVNLQGVSAEKKGDTKTESSINASSRLPDKKVPNTEGKMPIKKEDISSSDGTKPFTITTNQETDRKSSNLTASSNNVMQSVTKDPGVKKFASIINKPSSDAAGEKSSQVILPLKSVNNSTVKEAVQNSNIKSIRKLNVSEINVENSVTSKESVISKTAVSQSFVTAQAVQLTSSTTQKTSASVESNYSKVLKSSETTKTFVNGNAETTEISKIEVTKITPSTVPGIVPTVNVVFRTKSPLDTFNKDENRKKVVIETTTNHAPVSSAVIMSPKPLNTPSVSSVTQSVGNALKTVENLQQSMNSSPKLPEKNSNKISQQNSELTPASEKIETKTSISADASHILAAGSSINSDNGKVVDTSSVTSKVTEHTFVPKTGDKLTTSDTSKHNFTEPSKIFSTEKSVDIQNKVSVVDLIDWNKKFQLTEPEPPRAPLRRRAQRDSLPPLLPIRSPSRFGSLKHIGDSPRYVPRSPSQSSLPQRYSYTEMLSKVASMGVLPFVEPTMSKSCSSSSSQVSELWSELSEEQSTATHASEMLEAETTERMRLEKEVHELQNRFSHAQQRSDKMEMEIMESRVYRSELNGDLSEDEDAEASASIYKQKYERAVKDMEILKRRIQQQQEEEMEQKALMKKASDKRLAEALEDVDEERQIANQWKRKAQKCGAELQDLRLMLEEQMARNGELEKKQRRFDAELSAAQEEIKKEKALREKLQREKDQAIHEKYSLEQDLQSAKLDADMLHEKIAQLTRELDELTLSSKGEEEVTQLKRAKQDLERKSRDQEEELEELAAQVQMLEQAKLRLEMSLEKLRQEHRREASVREEEIEEIRASFSKKIKNLEAQLESEQDERHQLVKQKHELERRLYEIADQPPPHDPEIERRLRRDLKRTKALLRDAQAMLEHTREGQSSKTLIRQLKNQLEDSEFAKATAIKARQAIETELQDCQLQLEEVTRAKNEAETKCLQLSREKSAIQTQLEEAEEEMGEVMKKYKAVVAQLNEVSHKFEHLAGQSDDTHKVHWLDSKIRDLESKLELEQTTKARLESQIARLKEQNDRAREECDSLRNKEIQGQEGVRRLQRQLRDLREDYSSLQQKEADGYRKQHELEMALENMETDLQVTKNDLRLACQRIQDLQNALEDDLDSGTDVPDDSGSDSDSSFELSVLRNQSLTPIQRCESIASNLSYDTEGRQSRTSSFTQELSAFSSRA
ncbi:Unconventional myosin-XVIIIa [Araneus ventricosus]|uniref:Unconventional myosin-XVIIIa n=1 Tax=Araneus ventricosus TaxID=182803 RepID=A0A4Y2D2Q8_ARAVE|nr:Unconventional myosin-XVIIIa [Araneus ventricosus]